MTEDLYNAKDKERVRKLLTEEQGNLCAITGLPIGDRQHILEHGHDDQMFVRGVAGRQANSALGVFERAWIRYLRWWYDGDLPTFLRQCADYLEREPDTRWRHDSWLKKLQTMFNTLPEASKRSVLSSMNQPEGSNSTERKKLFKVALMTRKFTFEGVKQLIEKEKTK